MSEIVERFPLFPLGLVLLPSETVPLHIFEERYKLMIGECLDSDGEFGIIWLSDDGLRDVGCSATVTELLERMDDGRMNILVQGTRPFSLLRRIDDMDYPAGDVEMLDDEPGDADPDTAEEARKAYADLVERVTDEHPEESALSELDAYGMAATIDFALDSKQKLLELRSEDERMRAIATLFEGAMKRVDHMERAAERAKSNGKVRF
jgi:Lon protease-like protein